MAQSLCFYRDLTDIAENRIRELIMQAGRVEQQDEGALPQAGAYYRACALTVFLAWRDVTEGWQTQQDCDRLTALAGAQGLLPAAPRQDVAGPTAGPQPARQRLNS